MGIALPIIGNLNNPLLAAGKAHFMVGLKVVDADTPPSLVLLAHAVCNHCHGETVGYKRAPFRQDCRTF